jgi:hypothetical protein
MGEGERASVSAEKHPPERPRKAQNISKPETISRAEAFRLLDELQRESARQDALREVLAIALKKKG